MRGVYQTRFGVGEGNCLAACVASILELPEPPDDLWESVDGSGYTEDGERWWDAFEGWALDQGFLAVFWYDADAPAPRGYAIGSGPSPRATEADPFHHAVVVYDGQLAWDPHPSGEGVREYEDWILLVPLVTRGDGG